MTVKKIEFINIDITIYIQVGKEHGFPSGQRGQT